VARRKASFGSVRRLPSRRWQARYTAPDLVRHTAAGTFDTRSDAEAWLAQRRTEIAHGTWAPVRSAVPTLAVYAETWIADRELKPRTRAEYRGLLDRHILPALGEHTLDTLTPAIVRMWHARMKTGPTARAHAYSLLKTILATAVTDDVIPANPCRVRGAASAKRVKQIRPATLDELTALVEALPARYRALALLSAWCGLRFGEAAALTRTDLDRTNGIVRVRRAVVRVNGDVQLGTPKSAAGVRDVRIPPHLLPLLAAHVLEHAAPGRDGLLFPGRDGRHLAPSTLHRVFVPARAAAGRPDLRFHDLRHTGAVLAAQTGATLAELMNRLGHTTAGAAMRYQHASADRDLVVARALSALATGDNSA